MRMMMSWLIIAVQIAFGLYLMYKLAHVHETEGEFWKNLIQEQFPVVVGLPMAGPGSLFLMLVLRISTGPIEFEVGGVKFQGGAEPIVNRPWLDRLQVCLIYCHNVCCVYHFRCDA
jgi:hypothetical protein